MGVLRALALAIGSLLVGTAWSQPVTLACSGHAVRYTADYKQQVERVEPFEFTVVLDLAEGRLLGAPVSELERFWLEQAPDAVFFFRDAAMGEQRALEWISINRISGRYANFIAPRDPASGALLPPTLLAAAGCR